jgi:hypothetical protein
MKEIDTFGLLFDTLHDIRLLGAYSYYPMIKKYMTICCTELEYISYGLPFFPKSAYSIIAEMIYGAILNKEESLYGIIKEIVPKISKLKVIEKKGDNRNIPDIWFSLYGEIIPCEVKKYAFDKKAVEQLGRCMVRFNCRKGLVIAATIDAPLGPGMDFILLSDIYENAFRAKAYNNISESLDNINKKFNSLYEAIDTFTPGVTGDVKLL